MSMEITDDIDEVIAASQAAMASCIVGREKRIEMVDIWRYENKRIKLTDSVGKEYTGRVTLIWEAEEMEEDEDVLDLDTGTQIISFMPSEIAKIEEIK